jgi:hypothetical protein
MRWNDESSRDDDPHRLSVRSGCLLALVVYVAAYWLIDAMTNRPLNWQRTIAEFDLDEHQQAALEAYLADFTSTAPRASITNAKQIRSDSLERLFPECRFFRIGYRTRKSLLWNRSSTAGVVRQLTVAADFDRGEFVRLSREGNFEEFGELLAARNVRLTNQVEAELIWNGFRDVIGARGWNTGSHVRISETRWELNRHAGNGGAYWYAVTTDSEGTIEAAQLESEL